jgi:hypothetical protein
MDRDDYYSHIPDIERANDLLASNVFSFDPETRKITFQSQIAKVYTQMMEDKERKKMEDEERKKMEDEERKKMEDEKSWLNWLRAG